jgi:hypothetical protein
LLLKNKLLPLQRFRVRVSFACLGFEIIFFDFATVFELFFLHFFIFYFMNIFVAKLNYDTTDDTLLGAFEEFGTVDSAKVIIDKFTGRSKGFGFVEMPNDSEAKNAINTLNETELDGRTIVVKVAEPKGERPQRRERY